MSLKSLKPEYVAAFVLGVGGLVLIVGSVPGTGATNWPATLVAPGVALIVTAATLSLGARAAVGWKKQRRREIKTAVWQQRAVVYEEVISGCISAFTSEPAVKLAEQRAKIALWGSSTTVEAFGAWFRHAQILANNDGGKLAEKDKPEMWGMLFAAISAARAELPDQATGSRVTQHQTMSMIFDDYLDVMGRAGLLDNE